MPRLPKQLWSRTFSTTKRARTTIPTHFSYNPYMPSLSTSTPKLGRVARWYLPTMALIAVGTILLPTNIFTSHTPSKRTVTLDSANRTIGFAIANALEHHNRAFRAQQLTQDQRNQMLLDAYGSRSSLEDMERVFETMGQEPVVDAKERNRRLLEAYGEKASLRDLEKAMQIYEVQ